MNDSDDEGIASNRRIVVMGSASNRRTVLTGNRRVIFNSDDDVGTEESQISPDNSGNEDKSASDFQNKSSNVENSFDAWHRNCNPELSDEDDLLKELQSPMKRPRTDPRYSDTSGESDVKDTNPIGNLFKKSQNSVPILEEQQHFVSVGRVLKKTSGSYIDTHCHLDLLFRNEQHLGSFQEYRKNHMTSWARSFEGCITVFCFPELFLEEKRWSDLVSEPGVYGTFGCHPHVARQYNQELEDVITARLCHEKVVAVGEMGLDYTRKSCQEKALQKVVFRSQLKLALDRNMPIVIHCRDAEADCFSIMKEVVPHNTPIHRHCFKESYEVSKQWTDHFTKLKFGFTPYVVNERSDAIDEVLEKLPLERILIETDSPFFMPEYFKECGQKWCHPGMGFVVAAKLADVRNAGIVEILEELRRNTTQIYGI